MDKKEIALELTLAAIQHDKLLSKRSRNTTDENVEENNIYNARQIADFYNNLLANINIE